MDSYLSIIFVVFLLIFCITIFIRISNKIRHGGGSLPYFISSGAMDATLDKEKKAATAMVVERNAHKKMDEQSSSRPFMFFF